MTSPAKPWWQAYLEGHAEPRPGRAAPEFVDLAGITPAGWEPEGIVRFDWRPPPNMRTPGGWVQGGFQSVVLDMAQTFAVFVLLPEQHAPMTLEMKTSYLDSAFAERFVVEGRTVRLGRHVAHTDGSIRDEAGKLIATSTSTHVIKRFD